MTFLPSNNNFFPQGNLFEKLIGGVTGAYYGNKKDNLLGGFLGGMAGYKNPTTLYERIMDRYLPNQSTVILKKDDEEL